MSAARSGRDRGAALVLTLFAISLVMLVGTAIMSATVSNLRMSRLSQDAGAALDAADAGVAQVTAHLRTFGVRSLACSPSCPIDPDGTSFGNSQHPKRVVLSRAGALEVAYEVWVETTPTSLPSDNPGRYIVHSVGTVRRLGSSSSSLVARREIRAEIRVGTRPLGLPLALFARSFDGGGTGGVFQESILSPGCIWSRGHINVSGTDVAYGIPAAVHSSSYVSDSEGGNANCGPSSKNIHRSSTCNPAFPYDHSGSGGPFASDSTCARQTGVARVTDFYRSQDLDGDGAPDVTGSRIRDENTLRRLFNVPEKPFTDAQLDQLRQVARSQGNYWTSNTYTTPTPTVTPHAVLFFDLTAGGHTGQRVDLNMGGWARPFGAVPGSAECKDQSLLIVIVGGDARINANTRLVANIVLTSPSPYGKMNKLNGGAELIGTVYADAMDLTGTGDVKLDQCFVQNLSPSLVDTTLTIERYAEVDRRS